MANWDSPIPELGNDGFDLWLSRHLVSKPNRGASFN